MTYVHGSGHPIGSTSEVRHPSWSAYGYNAWGLSGGAVDGPPLGLGGYRQRDISGRRPGMAPTLESAVVAPSDMTALGDEFVRSRNPSLDGMLNRSGLIAPSTRFASVSVYKSKTPPKKQPAFLSHRGKANRAFVDGHIESEDMRKTFEATDNQLKRWHVDNKPHREALTD